LVALSLIIATHAGIALTSFGITPNNGARPAKEAEHQMAAPHASVPIDAAQSADATQSTKQDDASHAGNEDIVVTGRTRSPGDPLAGLNVKSYAAVQSVDNAVTGPLAMAYRKAVPRPIRSGLRNFLSNLQEPVVAVNYLLQFKPGKSAETVGRFAVNSTVGVAGVLDVAKKRPFRLPRRTNGFAYTLGYHGIGPGPFLYLPFIGPTTARDLVGRVMDVSFLPFAAGSPFDQAAFSLPTTAVRLLDERAESDAGMRKMLDGVMDPYAVVRKDYLGRRQAEINALHGTRRSRRQQPLPSATPDEGAVVPPT
jgi:phospholipid-binding lipoprotein MlaA